jgi:hypothetical protein
MHFTDDEISLSRRMREHGLSWEPAVGHYVYDETGLIEVPSPFQEQVYFILDMKHFLRRAGSMEALQTRMLWLPQWHQARGIARDLGIPDRKLSEQLASERALESGTELGTLYRLILAALRERGRADETCDTDDGSNGADSPRDNAGSGGGP